MSRFVPFVSLAAFLLLAVVSAPTVFAENEGQEDLDKATQLKVSAETLDDLNEVVDHAETALEKGLDAENKKFAQQLLISSLMQRGQLYAAAVFNIPLQEPQRNLRVMQFRQFALTDLQRAVGMDEKQAEAQLLIGKLQSLPLGDENAARKALTKVIDSDEAAPDLKAEAYALRSTVLKDEEKQLADLNRAVELQAGKPDYYRLRAQRYYGSEKLDEALADVDKALTFEPDHAGTNELRGMILLGQNKYDDALKAFDKYSELTPGVPLPFQHRGELFRQKGDLKQALEQLTKALELQPENVVTLMLRANIYFELKETDKALADIDQAIKAQPTLMKPHLMKIEILAAANRVGEAVTHLEKLVQQAPDNEDLLNQLGTFYLVANRPRKSIEVATKVLKQDPDDYAALRFRADAYLNIGKHSEAIADFDKAYTLREDDQSLLNNFAWVLATSPDDKVRDGARALKMATKAAEGTGYEVPHILSTLAAAYAETGDFDNAAKWSQKSVDLAQKLVDEAKAEDDKTKLQTDRDQLKKELDSYHEHKPTRERQTAEDDADAPKDDHAATDDKSSTPGKTANF